MSERFEVAIEQNQWGGLEQGATELINRSSRSFSIAASFLPATIRPKVCALYAWCRSVDDAVDHALSPSAAKEALDHLENDLTRSLDGEFLVHPASEWIKPLLVGRQIDLRHARELIQGMRMDLQGFSVNTLHDLEKYCYHAAGTVGLMLASLMDVKDRAAYRPAVALGVAMQMTNIARDVREDAERGRSYLPGISNAFAAPPDQLAEKVALLLSLAEDRYNQALEGLDYLPWRCRMAIRVALEVYREIGREIKRRNYSVMEGRTVISKRRLAWVSLRAIFVSALDTPYRLFHNFVKQAILFSEESIMNQSTDPTESFSPCSPRQAKQIAFLGLSLTSIMATALFVMVYVNPKSTEYSYLPLIYAGASLVASILFHRLSVRYETTGS